ncbi:MAG: ABC transporter ATP-binding protein, partial [Planctomycetes bacterium]|nr:ABC transporter ATP-binding protein [Planctomycetota bacterium]
MKNFFRSLGYLKPYRGRLIVSLMCVAMIGVLWAGGLGMIAPVLKVMIDREGLHGWIRRTAAEDRLGAKVRIRGVSQSFLNRSDGAPTDADSVAQPTVNIVEVGNVRSRRAGAKAGIKRGHWIIAIEWSGENRKIWGEQLIRALWNAPVDAPVRLNLYDPAENKFSEVVLTLDAPSRRINALTAVGRWIPEPANIRDRFVLLVWVLGVGLAVTVLRDIFRFLHEYIVQTTVWHGVMDLRCDNFNVALRLPVTFYASHGTSDTMSRFIQDTNVLAGGQITLFGKSMAEPAKAMGSLAMALLLSWKRTLVATLIGPPAFIFIRQFGQIMKRASKRALESWAAMLGVLSETFSGIRVVKTYTMESTQRMHFFNVSRQLFKQQRRMSRIDAAASPMIEAMGVTVGLTAAAIGGWWVLADRIDGFIFMTWMACLAGMFDPVRKLARVLPVFQQAETAAERLFELQDQEQEKRRSGAVSLPNHEESLEFRGVSYRYPDTDIDAIKNINLEIRCGETVALVGPNGCGKTTLVSLVPRLMDPSAGSILL